jgi:hypothetical protein
MDVFGDLRMRLGGIHIVEQIRVRVEKLFSFVALSLVFTSFCRFALEERSCAPYMGPVSVVELSSAELVTCATHMGPVAAKVTVGIRNPMIFSRNIEASAARVPPWL